MAYSANTVAVTSTKILSICLGAMASIYQTGLTWSWMLKPLSNTFTWSSSVTSNAYTVARKGAVCKRPTQHMIGKGHCKIDISGENSEFRDFYDFDASEGDESSYEDEEDRLERRKVAFVDAQITPCVYHREKVLLHRMQEQPRRNRDGKTQEKSTSASISPPLASDMHQSKESSSQNQF